MARVSLSASTITRRIDEIAEDSEAQLLERINESPWYTVQVDESTDVDNKATMLVLVRYIFQKDVHEGVLCALLLPASTTAAELVKSLNDYTSGKLNWSFCVRICTDGTAAVTGRLSGFTTRVKEVASECGSTHCVIQREMLASRKMSPELNVLQDVIRTINHIKVHALNSRLFAQLCEKDAEHTHLLLYTGVRWLSKRRSLARVFELREPLQRFLLEKQPPLAAHFSDTEWVAKLAYLCGIYSTCSTNSICHFRVEQPLCSSWQIKWLHSKPNWNCGGRQVNIGIFDMFPTVAEILKETEPGPSFSQLVHDHHLSFQKSLSITSQPQKTPELGRNGSITHL